MLDTPRIELLGFPLPHMRVLRGGKPVRENKHEQQSHTGETQHARKPMNGKLTPSACVFTAWANMYGSLMLPMAHFLVERSHMVEAMPSKNSALNGAASQPSLGTTLCPTKRHVHDRSYSVTPQNLFSALCHMLICIICYMCIHDLLLAMFICHVINAWASDSYFMHTMDIVWALW